MLHGSISEGRLLPARSAGSDDEDDDFNLDWVVWSAEDVGDWVDGLLGAGMGVPFRRDEVDGPALVRLSDEELRSTLGIRDPLQRAKLLGHLRAFRAQRERLARRAARRKAAPGRQTRAAQQLTPPSGRSPPPPLQTDSGLRSATSSVSGGPSCATPGSRRLGSSNASVAGMISIGQESPSNSLRGSFSTSLRPPLVHAVDSPGPCAYNTADTECSSAKTASPFKATIGNSPRRTSEYFTREGDGPGPSYYNVDSSMALRKSASPRPTIGNSQRRILQHYEADDPAPGPSSYVVNNNALRSSSPRPTIGNSPRDTMEFIVSRDTAALARRGSGCRSAARLPSPRARGNAAGS